MDLKRRPVVRQATALQQLTSQAVPKFVQFALPSVAMAAAAPADRPTEPERSSGQ